MHFYRVLTLFLLFCVLPSALAGSYLNHVVLLWLKPDTPEQRVQHIIAKTKELIKVSEVKYLSVGPAIASQRSMVDDSFHIGIHMQFRNVDEMSRYLKSESHIRFVKEQVKPFLEKIVVYDF